MADSAPSASRVQALTPREITTLTAVAGLMGDVPAIDYEVLAPLIGQKYSKNARANVKKLFEKLRNGGPSSAKSDKQSTPTNSDGEEGEFKKKTGKKAANTTPKKTVGPRATPKKAAGEKKAATPRKSKAKIEEEVKDEVEGQVEVEVTSEDGDTKAELMDEDGGSISTRHFFALPLLSLDRRMLIIL
ncbi:hypothetical protein BJ875DRAFT_482540 [Amylocarpus encephaloides]|uniref:Uncharacterized protein n=1 Tax=Amylocarpus encephaloides TaxID=45428 RepID=A0A9P7YMT9_9HELO|nr:hypothetical protein BJ875DRAFT_482540 [Amylocarpus encephaloides]